MAAGSAVAMIGANLRFGINPAGNGTMVGGRVFQCHPGGQREAVLVLTLGGLGIAANLTLMAVILAKRHLRRWSQGLLFHQAMVDCARAAILLPLGVSIIRCQPVNKCSLVETAFLLLVTVSTVNMLTTVLNDSPVFPEDENDEQELTGPLLMDSPQCVLFGAFMIWFASITINLGPTFLSGALAANVESGHNAPSCPLVHGPFRHYVLNVLWILINLICVILTLFHLRKLHRDLTKANVEAVRVAGLVTTLVSVTGGGIRGGNNSGIPTPQPPHHHSQPIIYPNATPESGPNTPLMSHNSHPNLTSHTNLIGNGSLLDNRSRSNNGTLTRSINNLPAAISGNGGITNANIGGAGGFGGGIGALEEHRRMRNYLRRMEQEGVQRVKMFLIITAAYVLFWGPLFFVTLVHHPLIGNQLGYEITLHISYFHAVINPTLFLLLHRGLRQALFDICCGCCFQCTHFLYGLTDHVTNTFSGSPNGMNLPPPPDPPRSISSDISLLKVPPPATVQMNQNFLPPAPLPPSGSMISSSGLVGGGNIIAPSSPPTVLPHSELVIRLYTETQI